MCITLFVVWNPSLSGDTILFFKAMTVGHKTPDPVVLWRKARNRIGEAQRWLQQRW